MRNKLTLGVRPIAVALASFGLLAAVQSVHAATYTVTNTNDAGAGSLRDAITQANANAGADTIVFSGVSGTITLTTGQLSITDSVTITGPGAASLSISGNNASRVFEIYNGSQLLETTISDLSIINGAAINGAGMLITDETTTLNRVAFVNNAATDDGGAIHADGFNMTLSISDCTFSGNRATGSGGAIYIEDTGAPLTISRSVFFNNTANRGGAIYLYDPDDNVTIDQSVFWNNSATQTGGAIYLYSMDDGALTISNSLFTGNTAATGGAIYLYDVDVPTVIVNSTFTSNSATAGSGGAIAIQSVSGTNMTIRETTIVGNTATTNGGGISSEGSSDTPVALINTVIAGNTAPSNADAGGSLLLSATNSLIQSTTLSITNNGGLLQNIAPNIGALAANAGPSVGAPNATTVLQSMLPNAGSPLIDAGTATGVQATDQRGVGFPRIAGSAPDIGAVEYEVFPVTEVVTPAGGGTLVCTPDPVPRGGSTTCVATANVGYAFVSQTGDCSSMTASCTMTNVSSAKTVTANFALNAYPVVVTVASGVGGSVICTPNPVPHGQNAACSATPSPGYTFVGFSGDCSGLNCTLTNVTASRTVNASFVASAPQVVPLFSWLHTLIMVGAVGLAAGLRRRSK